TLDGSNNVQTWADQFPSPTANDATQSTALARPSYTSSDSKFNGKPSVVFNVGLSLSLTTSISPSGGGEMFLVIYLANDPPALVTHSGLMTFGSSGNDTHFPFTDGVVYDNFATDTRKTTVDPTPSLTSARLYNVTSIANEWTSRLDNTQIFTTATNTVAW